MWRKQLFLIYSMRKHTGLNSRLSWCVWVQIFGFPALTPAFTRKISGSNKVIASTKLEGKLFWNREVSTSWIPGFGLFKLTNAKAGVFPTLAWKWSSACGKTIISPFLSVLKYALLFVSIKPAIIFPFIKMRSSDTRCVWIGTTPPTPMSNRAIEIPKPFTPGNWGEKAEVKARLNTLRCCLECPSQRKQSHPLWHLQDSYKHTLPGY